MDRSRLSNIVATTQLLPHLSSENLTEISKCIWDQLGCENESQFICKALTSLYKTLSFESTTIIKNKAMQLSMTNAIAKKPNSNIETASLDNNEDHVTLLKKHKRQLGISHDILSKLHSDIVDYLGTFLDSKQSIEIGYLNKHLLVETQKQSYVLKTCKDRSININDRKMKKLVSSKNDGFNYLFGKHLVLSLTKRFDIKKAPFFNNFFCAPNRLTCWNLLSLSYIPVDVLFNSSNNNFWRNEENKGYLERLAIYANDSTKVKLDDVKKFCTQLKKYKKHCIKSGTKMKMISELEIKYHNCRSGIMKRLLLGCRGIYQSLYLGNNTNVRFKRCTLKDLNNIFDKNLIHLRFGSGASIQFNVNINNKKHNNDDGNDTGIIGSLKKISFEAVVFNGSCNNNGILQSLKCLDQFSMRGNVECYSINWYPGDSEYHNDKFDDSSYDVLNKIFLDYDKHPMLKQIKISFVASLGLYGLTSLFAYFNKYYQNIFGQRKLNQKYFEKIEIHFNVKAKKRRNSNHMAAPHHYNMTHALKQMLGQKVTKRYPGDENAIQIKDANQGIDSFCSIYRNVIVWLQLRQEKFAPNFGEGLKNCKIVFLF